MSAPRGAGPDGAHGPAPRTGGARPRTRSGSAETAEVWVRAGGGRRDYPVIVGSGLRDRIPELVARFADGVHRWSVVTDANVAPLYGQALAEALAQAGRGGPLLVMPAGEAHKTRNTWANLTDQLLEAGVGRDGGVLAVGGGVVGDVAGFVAATYMRGIPVVQVPTSLLAMIDASVGGKTGVDTPAGKNLVGSFHPPAAVLVDPEVIATLPAEERAQGLVEAVKHGAILDPVYGEDLFRSAGDVLAGEPEAVGSAVLRSIQLKARVVSQDEEEAGVREILNFGHTAGHALERAADFELAHGSAVVLGMVAEARLGEALGVTRPGTAKALTRWLEPLGLPLAADPADRGALEAALRLDKKGRKGVPRTVLLDHLGTVAPAADGRWAHPVPPEALLDAIPFRTPPSP